MLHEIYPKQFINHYQNRQPMPTDIVFDYHQQEICLHPDQTFFQVKDIKPKDIQHFLFCIDNIGFYLGDLSDYPCKTLPIFMARTYQPKHLGYACAVGYQFHQWIEQNQFCGKCGTKLKHNPHLQALDCPHCGNQVFPRLNPAVIVGILNPRNELLVTKYASGPYSKHALVAGYCEFGETVEETVKREVKEETGLNVFGLQYYKSQPWPFSSSLLFGFWCRTDTYELNIDHSELKEGEWKTKDDFFDTLDGSSLTSEMIRLFQSGYIYDL